MQVLIAISGFCPRIGNVPCTTPFDFLFVISIHVPTWGTTLSISTNLFALIFQSTFPRGERHHQPGYHYLLHSFQSTFLCGERRHITRMQLTTLHFNPRSRVGNDGWSYSDRICDRDFNPHSCVGNDTKCEKKLRSYPDFNPRSLVGNDDSKHPRHCFFSISIHVPSWGTTMENTLSAIQNTLKYRILHPSSIICTLLRHFTQTSSSCSCLCIYIISNHYQHFVTSFPQKHWITVQISS